MINMSTLIKAENFIVIRKSGMYLQNSNTKYIPLVLIFFIKMVQLIVPIALLVIMLLKY